MPIRFRCGYCNKLLGIARRKAGTRTTCPHCGATITVPTPDGDQNQVDLEEIDVLLNGGNPPPPPTPQHAAGEPPLFERDLDSVLGPTNPPPQRSQPPPQPAPTPGMDASTLGSAAAPVVISSQKATAIVVAVVVLLTVAFVAGFLIASR